MSKKRIIVCCDGTWNDLRMRYITNVGRLLQCLLPEGPSEHGMLPQVVYYDDGVGADAEGFRRMLEGGIGKGLDNLVYEAYRFICVNYNEGDEICLFGFSRGAYTARSVAGMIGRLGVVPRTQLKWVPSAMEAYRARRDVDVTCKAFCAAAKSVPTKVAFLGCWDTVGALGIPDKTSLFSLDRLSREKYEFHDTTLGRHIARAAHAVAIDERRKEFQPTLMERPKSSTATKLREVWFAGDHGCVGGGSWEKRGLSNITLRWMIDAAAELGLELGADLSRLHDKAVSDHRIYFDATHSWMYRDEARSLAKHNVRWSSVHATVGQRWRNEPSYQPRNVTAIFRKQLGNRNAVKTASEPAGLVSGEERSLRVDATKAANGTGVLLTAGSRYRLVIPRVQVWKDGDLDPCDARGWNTVAVTTKEREAKLAWKDGEQLDGSILDGLTRRARSKSLVPEADWLELVAAIGGGAYRRLGLTAPEDESQPFTVEFKAWDSGELMLAPNDLSHKLDLIDRYDNNEGWLWVTLALAAEGVA